MVKNNIPDKILIILKKHPQGLTMLEIAELIGISRHAITKYIYLLVGKGNIYIREVGTAKLCYFDKGRGKR